MQTERSRRLLRSMLRIRLIEEGIAEAYAEQQMRCPVHLCIGQEAVSSAVCDLLGTDDQVMSSHRAHGHYLAKGGNLPAMLAEMYGKETGCSGGMGGSMHLIDLAAGFVGATPIVGSTIPISVGLAFASAMRGESRVVVAFFGEGATEEGTFHEALNFAALKRLSILFVCENNLYSVYSPMSVRRPAGRPIFRLAAGHGIESRQGDGNDVEQVYSLAQEALGQVRAGAGPVFLEFATYRWREHCGPNFDNRLGYRTEEEFLRWRDHCPIERHRQRGIDESWLSEADMKGWSDEIRAEFSAAVAFAKASAWPAKQTMLDNVYASGDTPAVAAHRRAA